MSALTLLSLQLIYASLSMCRACEYVNRVSLTNSPIPTGMCAQGWFSAEKYECEDGVAYRYEYLTSVGAENACGGDYSTKTQVTTQSYNCGGSGSCPYVSIVGYTDCDKTSVDLRDYWVVNTCSDGVKAKCTDTSATLTSYANSDCTGTSTELKSYTAGCTESGSVYYELTCAACTRRITLLFVLAALSLLYAN
mmetsp:Transcript_43953/g.70480  ORF Transcript_43953/g.70480 Transcript_43953/m.70480 type:complete len:194 (+) Transcript_43953:35-616(+)